LIPDAMVSGPVFPNNMGGMNIRIGVPGGKLLMSPCTKPDFRTHARVECTIGAGGQLQATGERSNSISGA